MLILTISMKNEKREVLESRKVQIINGSGQVKDHVLDCMYSWLDSRNISSKSYETYEGKPVLYVRMKNGDYFVIVVNMMSTEDPNLIISVPDASLAGTGKIGEIRATYEELLKAFGEPCESDGYKVSGVWILQYRGKVYAIYDYKQTFLYDDSLPTVEDFRSDKKPKIWNIGGSGDIASFLNTLHKQLIK